MFRMVSRLPVLLALPVVAALAACSPQPAGTDAADMPDFAPTRDNAVLGFGDTARVATEDPATGTQVQWEITVERPRRITGTQAANNLRSPDPQRFAAFSTRARASRICGPRLSKRAMVWAWRTLAL